MAPSAGVRRDRLRYHQQHGIRPGALHRYGEEILRSRKSEIDSIVAGAAVGVVQQLAAGSLNIAQAATDQSLRAILRGAPIRIIAGAASNAPFRVVAAKTINSWSDLKGKTISVGGLTDVTL